MPTRLSLPRLIFRRATFGPTVVGPAFSRFSGNSTTFEIFKVRATVATHTRAAPARRRTRAHSDAVVPVV